MKSIVETHPWLIVEWNDERNASDFTFGCCKKVQWKCKLCNNVWSTRVQHRANGKGCPICSVDKVKKTKLTKINNENSFLGTHPELSKEWSDSNKLRPENIKSGCNKKIQWKCKSCENIWSTSPNARANYNHGCPYCSGRKTILEKSLKYTHPKLCEEWYDERYKTTELSYGSGKKINWKCIKCNHVWLSSVNNRTQGRGCPMCDKSKPIRKIIDLFNEHNIDYKMEHKIPECKNHRVLPFDFAIFQDGNLKALIEYQGKHHFKPIWGKKRYEKCIENDKIKKEFCLKNSIPLIEITENDDIHLGLFFAIDL